MVQVKVYSTPSCPWCRKTKEFLRERNISFKDIDVSTNYKAAREMIEKSGQQGVPVTEVGDDIIIGFNEEKLKRALNLK